MEKPTPRKISKPITKPANKPVVKPSGTGVEGKPTPAQGTTK